MALLQLLSLVSESGKRAAMPAHTVADLEDESICKKRWVPASSR